MTRTVRPVSRRSVANVLQNLRSLRKQKDELEKLIPEKQDLAVELLDGVDPDGVGFKYTDDDPEGRNYAFVQRNSGTPFWDEESLVAWLHENGQWTACSTRVLDIRKVEALIRDADTSPVTKKTLLGFTKQGTPPRPFIRFGKEAKKNK